jgi:hypothetical protein
MSLEPARPNIPADGTGSPDGGIEAGAPLAGPSADIGRLADVCTALRRTTPSGRAFLAACGQFD